MSTDATQTTATDYRRAYAILGSFARADDWSGPTYQAIIGEVLDSEVPAHDLARLVFAVASASVLTQADREAFGAFCSHAVSHYSQLETETPEEDTNA